MKTRTVEEAQPHGGKNHPISDLEGLTALASAICGVFDLGELLEIALDKILELSCADKGTIHLLNDGDEALVLHAHRGLSAEYVRNCPRLSLGEQLPGRVAVFHPARAV